MAIRSSAALLAMSQAALCLIRSGTGLTGSLDGELKLEPDPLQLEPLLVIRRAHLDIAA